MKITQQNQSANKYMLCIAFSFKNESVSVYQLHFIELEKEGNLIDLLCIHAYLFMYLIILLEITLKYIEK